MRIAVDAANLDIYTRIVRDGSQDPAVLRMCLRLVKQGEVFFDVGANAGFMSLSLASRFRDQVTVVAFEPQPSLARCIAISAHLNGLEHLRVLETMLGARDGQTDLYLAAHAIHASSIAREAGAIALARPVWRIDSLIAEHIVAPPAVIKIDVEGSELDVLRGAERLLREKPPCLIMESDDNMARFGYRRDDLLGYLSSRADYEFFGILGDGSVTDVRHQSVRDVLALPQGRTLADDGI